MNGFYRCVSVVLSRPSLLLILLQLFSVIRATVAPIVPGEPLWFVAKRIGLAVDDIARKIDLIHTPTASSSSGIVGLGQSTIAGGQLSISSSGSYRLKGDVAAQVTINATSVLLDMNGQTVIGTIQLLSGSNIIIRNGFITPLAPTSSADPAGITVAAGVSRLFIESVTIQCADAPLEGGVAGRDALSIAAHNVHIRQCSLIAGTGSSTISGTGGAGGTGIVLTRDARDVLLTDCVMMGADGGDATQAQAGGGGHGIAIRGATDVVIDHCTIFRAGKGGAGSLGAVGGDGGHGIALLTWASRNIFIKNCVIQKSGCGGNGVAIGGAAGHGICVASVGNAKIAIDGCTITDTGSGGNGSTKGGDGGSGVFIGSFNTSILVHHCTISNTGAAGIGGATIAGKAIADAVGAGTGSSKIYANVAHDIANSIAYDLQGISNTERGFALSNPPTSTAVNLYANVFM